MLHNYDYFDYPLIERQFYPMKNHYNFANFVHVFHILPCYNINDDIFYIIMKVKKKNASEINK